MKMNWAAHESANPTLFDTSMFNANNPPFQNAHLQQQQQRSQTPQQFPYQVNSVVPSKRPRPGDDGIAASPRQPPSSLNLSRSQTPQQVGYSGGFQANQQGQPLHAP